MFLFFLFFFYLCSNSSINWPTSLHISTQLWLHDWLVICWKKCSETTDSKSDARCHGDRVKYKLLLYLFISFFIWNAFVHVRYKIQKKWQGGNNYKKPINNSAVCWSPTQSVGDYFPITEAFYFSLYYSNSSLPTI